MKYAAFNLKDIEEKSKIWSFTAKVFLRYYLTEMTHAVHYKLHPIDGFAHTNLKF